MAFSRQWTLLGQSAHCDFNEIGDITTCRFRWLQVHNGKLEFLKIV